MTVPCEWCGEPMNPPFHHLTECDQVDIAELARIIVEGEDYVDAEAARVARAYLKAVER
jgi:hypothetical protein